LERTFTGAYEALDFLENEWPLRRGERHRLAIETCLGSLRGAVPASIGRDAFVAACIEAGMPAMVAPSKQKPAIHSTRPARVAII
jgi:hypothetical protein